MMLPAEVTDAAIASELPGAVAWAARHRVTMDTRLLPERIVRVTLVQDCEQEEYYLQGEFSDYKALPPVWDWRDKEWEKSSEPALSPNPVDNPLGSTFLLHHDKAIICAHFNRLAYGNHGGPHSDWGDPAQWTTTGSGHIRAVTIGDMLQSILRDFCFTKGRMQ